MSIELVGDDYRFPIREEGLYSDNTPMIKPGEGFDPTRVHTMVYRHSTTTSFVAAMFLVDSIYAQGGEIRTLVLPYIPGARQDRINPSGDNLFAASGFAEMINNRLFSRVIVLDPHSPVAPSLIDNVIEYPLSEVASQVWKGYTGIIAPDKGAQARAEIFAAALGKPIFYASKTRDVSTGKLSGFSVDIPEGGHYLVVDDICDGGGTFMGLGDKIKEAGAFADLYVTHGIFARNAVHKLKDYYKNIYTTDSLPSVLGNNPSVRGIRVVERMMNYYG